MKILNLNHNIVDSIEFGIVEAGKSKTLEYVLQNETIADVIDIKIDIVGREVFIDEYTKKLGAKKEGKLIVTWKPSITLKKGLKSRIQMTWAELWD